MTDPAQIARLAEGLSEDAKSDIVDGNCTFGRGSTCLCTSWWAHELGRKGILPPLEVGGGLLLTPLGLAVRQYLATRRAEEE